MKKKLLLLLIVVMAFSVMLMGCGSKGEYDEYDEADSGEMELEDEEFSSIEGTEWLVIEMYDGNGEQIPPEDVELTFGELRYQFKENGVVTVFAAGQEADSTWTQDGNRIDCMTNGVPSFYMIDGNIMTTENEGGKVVLELQ